MNESREKRNWGEGKPLIQYGPEGATFERSCPKCGRMVRAHNRAKFNGAGQPVGKNGRCRKCGPVEMPFIGYL